MSSKILSRLKEHISSKNLALKELATLTGMSIGKLSKILSGKQDLTLSDLDTLCIALGISISHLVSDNLLDPTKAVGENISRDIEIEILKNILLFDLVELLAIPQDVKSLSILTGASQEEVSIRLTRLQELGIVVPTVNGTYSLRFEIDYRTDEFYNVVRTKFNAAIDTFLKYRSVEEFRQTRRSAHVNAYLTQDQVRVIRDGLTFIISMMTGFHRHNTSLNKLNQKIELYSLHSVLNKFEVSHE